ncbi:MAG: GNAT family N-acetyltransferase [Desulfovibrio sp.]|nr:GNAT family N-acetyltransferase [Desulfovibrio sp.]
MAQDTLKNAQQSSVNLLFEPIQEQGQEERESLWQHAARNSELPDPYCSEPDWVMSYHLTHGRKRPMLMLFEHGNAVILAQEKMFNGEPVFVSPESSWLYDRPLLGADPLPLFFHAIDLIEKHFGKNQMPPIILGGIWPHHPLSNELLFNLGHIFSFFLYNQGKQCAASLEGGVDGFLSRRSPNFRAKLKKALRKAHAAAISYERVAPQTQAEVDATFSRMLKVEAQSWKGQEDNGILHPLAGEFYKELLRRQARKHTARVIFARHEACDIGFIFGGLTGVIYRGQQFSYDLHWKEFSIGNTLQYEQISWLCEEGALRYDMGPISGPKMSYKAHWTELIFPLESWILRR